MTEDPPSDVVRRDRFSGGPARGFLSSMDADERIFGADLDVGRAHVVMLAECDILAADDAGRILEALDAIEAAGFEALPGAEDVQSAIETAVIDRIGEAGRRLHTARSRNDEVATCLRYRLRGDLLEVLDALVELREVLLEAAEANTDTVMPGYTHLQPAQPTTLAHWLLSYEGALARDTARAFDALGRVNQSPLGAAAFAGTPFPIDRERTAALLGFDGLVENSMDAASSRDVLLEAAMAASTLTITLSGLAADVVLFANRGFVDLDDDYASTSSIMPQKKNPDTFELVRAAAGDAAAGVAGLQTTLKGLPRAYNRDLQAATPHVWRAVDAAMAATGVAAGGVATARWDEDRLAAAAGEGFSTATGIADRLAMAGVPFRTAHEIVAIAAETGTDYDALDAAAREVVGDSLESLCDREAIETALDPAASVASRDSRGGPAPDAVAAALGPAREQLADDADRLVAVRQRLDAAEASLAEGVDQFA